MPTGRYSSVLRGYSRHGNYRLIAVLALLIRTDVGGGAPSRVAAFGLARRIAFTASMLRRCRGRMASRFGSVCVVDPEAISLQPTNKLSRSVDLSDETRPLEWSQPKV